MNREIELNELAAWTTRSKVHLNCSRFKIQDIRCFMCMCLTNGKWNSIEKFENDQQQQLYHILLFLFWFSILKHITIIQNIESTIKYFLLL